MFGKTVPYEGRVKITDDKEKWTQACEVSCIECVILVFTPYIITEFD